MASDAHPYRTPSRSPRLSLPSVHLIPSPGVGRERPRRYEPLILRTGVVIGLALLMIALTIALEVALVFSQHNNGFGVHQKNVFGFVPGSLLTAFFPIVLVAPIARLWQSTDWAVRWFQPYVMLSKGNAKAEDTVLLDYMAYNKVYALLVSFRRKHWLVHVSIITALATGLVQPFAGSIFDLEQRRMSQTTGIAGERVVGLSDEIPTLSPFLAAAGFTDAATFQSLPDPPFVSDSWAIATFRYPTIKGNNANVTVNTTAVLTSVKCENPAESMLTLANPLLYTINLTLADGCQGHVAFNPTDAEQQYGVVQADPETCKFNADINVSFAPVMFWFFHYDVSSTNSSDMTPEGKGVICRPQIGVYDVLTTVFLNNGSVIDVQSLGNLSAANNVTGFPLNGSAYNGVLFDRTNDTFVASRAVSIQTGVPGSIFRFALQTDPSLSSFFASETGFLNITNKVYTQFLSVSAKSIYFVPASENLQGEVTQMLLRLVIVPFPAHCLAVLFLLIGIIGIAVHILHRRQRRELYLTAPPGSIATSMALAYHSGMGDLLIPYDDEASMVCKLGMLNYGIDRRTGAIVAVEREGGSIFGQDDAESTLLGHEEERGRDFGREKREGTSESGFDRVSVGMMRR
ncbi:hypothetical protein BKA93DRAFT_888841 [Sparassis latifolia]